MARRLHDRANEDMRKAIEEQTKSEHYKNRAERALSSNAIYNDDPNAIEKLKDKLERLEHERESIKAQEHHTWELTNIGTRIRETKSRIARLEKQENIIFEDISFNGGSIIHNKDINRIQFLFDEKPSEETRNILKHNGFHWSRNEGAWQREFNQNTIRVTDRLVTEFFNKEKTQEEEEELE